LTGTKIGKQNGTEQFGTHLPSLPPSYNRILSIVFSQFLSPQADTKRSNPPPPSSYCSLYGADLAASAATH